MNEPAIEEWAMEKALAIDLRWNNDTEWYFSIARAIMAADKAARERAASWHDNQAVEIEMSSKRVNGKMMTRKPLWHRQCAAAIRKGTDND